MSAPADRKPAIGFIGLGIMGKPMAKNLLAAGYALVVLNRSRAPVDELVALGAAAGETPREVAARSEVVITMLPDSPDVEAVALATATATTARSSRCTPSAARRRRGEHAATARCVLTVDGVQRDTGARSPRAASYHASTSPSKRRT